MGPDIGEVAKPKERSCDIHTCNVQTNRKVPEQSKCQLAAQ